MSARQREAGRKRRRNKRNRRGKVWVEVFPDRPVTKKPREVHNGKGRVKRRRTNERYVGRRWGERRRKKGCVTNGRGRKGRKEGGYEVYGEYRKKTGEKGSEPS